MTPTTPLKLLAILRQFHFPEIESGTTDQSWKQIKPVLEVIQHNCKACIAFCDKQLQLPHEEKDETFLRYCDAKKEAMMALVTANGMLAGRRRSFHKQLKKLKAQYDTLSSSIKFLIITGDERLEGAVQAAMTNL